MEKFNKENYLKILEERNSIQLKIDELDTKKVKFDTFLNEQLELLDQSMEKDGELTFDLNESLTRVRTTVKKVDTEKFIESMDKELAKLGKTGKDIYNQSLEVGSRIAHNKTNFIKSIKDLAKENNLNLNDMISQQEKENSTKTIKYKTVDATRK